MAEQTKSKHLGLGGYTQKYKHWTMLLMFL